MLLLVCIHKHFKIVGLIQKICGCNSKSCGCNWINSKNQFTDNLIEIAEESIGDRLENNPNLNEIEKIRLKRDIKNLERLKTAKRVKIVEKPSVAVLSLSTQPIHVLPPSDDKMSVFTNPSLTKEFVDYTGVRQAELDMIKMNRFVDKKVLDSHIMYANPYKSE